MAEQRLDRSGELDPAILLVDMDSFFASVEVRDDPSLRGKPVVVGGDGGRGVVASCTYEARKFGVRSAMPMATAKRLCPDAVVLPGRMGVYAAISRELKAILVDHSPLVEPLGLDEAFVDVTGSKNLLGTPYEIAHSIRRRIAEELHLNCGIGVGPSKSIAKLASRDAKPKIANGRIEPGPGVYVVLDDEVRSYLDRFNVRALYGVGPATAKTLANLGIERVSELAAMEPEILSRHVGHAHAHSLIALARGEDPRPVVADQASKSIGNEETYAADISERSELEGRLRHLAVGISGALRTQDRRARTITVKVKFADFRQVTRSHTLVAGIDDHVAIESVATALLGSLDVEEGVRLLGISTSNLESSDVPVQLQLVVDDELDDPGARAAILQFERAALDDAVDEIRARFGRHVVGTASMLDKGAINVPTQRTAPFGPGSGGPRTYDDD
jgi:DNA polymerase IV